MIKKFFKIFFLSLLGLLVLTIIIFNKNIPAFIYNEFESNERFYYVIGEQTMDAVYQLIDIRTGKSDVFVSDQDRLYKVKEDIDKGINATVELSNLYSLLLNRQDKIPFLPAKYKKYQEMKKIAFDNYRKGILIFRDVKAKEHTTFDLLNQIIILNDKMTNKEGMSNEEYWMALEENADIARETIKKAEQLYNDKFLDEGYKNYLIVYSQRIIDAYELAMNPEKTKNKESFEREIEKIYQKGSNLDFEKIYADWRKNIIDDLNKKVDEYDKISYQQMGEAAKYYTDNNLDKDLISRFLSVFSKKYPKNI